MRAPQARRASAHLKTPRRYHCEFELGERSVLHRVLEGDDDSLAGMQLLESGNLRINHPGGMEKIMTAAGGEVEPYWSLYRQHLHPSSPGQGPRPKARRRSP